MTMARTPWTGVEIDGVPATAGDCLRRLVRDHAGAERLAEQIEEVHDRIQAATAALLPLWEPGETKYLHDGTCRLVTLVTRTRNDDLSVGVVRLLYPEEVLFPGPAAADADQERAGFIAAAVGEALKFPHPDTEEAAEFGRRYRGGAVRPCPELAALDETS